MLAIHQFLKVDAVTQTLLYFLCFALELVFVSLAYSVDDAVAVLSFERLLDVVPETIILGSVNSFGCHMPYLHLLARIPGNY